MDLKIKNGLFILLLSILLLPVIQQSFPFIKSKELVGVFPPAQDISFDLCKWWDHSYQEQKTSYVNDHLGFRPDIIRFTNQAIYTLTKKINHKRIVEGEDHYLFLNNFIEAYYGKDFIGQEKVLTNTLKLKAIQDTLSRMGKTFVAVISPGKAYVYPEKFPYNYRQKKTHTNNYEAYVRAMDSLGVNLVDFNAWFVNIKNTAPEPIWSTLGIHWSVYGSVLACDSLERYLDKRRNITMNHPYWTKVERTTKPRFAEHDISAIMNMLYPIATVQYSYPVLSYPNDKTATRPRMVFIGDSFLLFWLEYGLLDSMSSNWEIWYYFGAKMDKDNHKGAPMDSYDWPKALSETDCVLFMYGADNGDELGTNFIEAAFNHFYPLGTTIPKS